ncbi:MAG: phenylalanine--tRNA ligase subunit beta [Clostridia bacterium]|nr:phenylalanine--tRNA ligase subunit beta [Clostridia bacterium]
MKVSLNWLKKYVDIDVPCEELCERMTTQGFEVEGIEKSSVMDNVVVAKILEIEKHPDSDHLQICQLDIGGGVREQIVTGADNVFVGATIPAALHDSHLPNGMHIKKGKLRGVVSNGMMCSGEELCLQGTDFPGADVYGILILDSKWEAGTDMNTVIGADDCVIDFSVTSNRPDCNCVLGIAREVAVCLNKEFRAPKADYTVKKDASAKVNVTVEDFDLCPRYVGATVENIRIAPSPKWLCDCLLSAGMRPINNIVDITNFVMLETGQPMHAFDVRDISNQQIIVRRAKENEELTTLDGKEHKLNSEMLVIADASRAVGIAGIMGGENSEVKDDTPAIFFESAKFRRDSVRKTARALGIATEASSRFEKGIDAFGCRFALDRALSLIDELNAGDVTSWSPDVFEELCESKTIVAPLKRIEELLGITVPTDIIITILTNLGIEVKCENDVLTCVIPSRRDDIEGVADIAEEIIRVYGYDHIESRPLSGVLTRGTKSKQHLMSDKIKELMVSCGANEIATYSFISQKAYDLLGISSDNTVKLINPLGEDYSIMRTQLFSSMLSVMALNENRGALDMRLFEISKIFLPKQMPVTEQPEERKVLAVGLMGKKEDFFTLKAVVETIFAYFGIKATYAKSEEVFMHPGRQAVITAGNSVLGYLGEIHPDVANKFGIVGRPLIAQIDLVNLFAIASSKVLYSALPKYPAIERDLAVLVDVSQPIGPMLDAIKSAGGALVKDVKLFDVYKSDSLGENKMSVAFSITMLNPERTLKAEEAQKVFDKIVRSLEYRFGASLRG